MDTRAETPSLVAAHSGAAVIGTPVLPRDDTWTASAIFTLSLLTLIAAFNYLDRSLLGLMLPLIKAEMALSDTTLGLLTGLVFATVYSTLGIPVAWLADRYNRRNIVSIGLTMWSLMTAVTGVVSNVWQLAAARFAMGAGEACSVAPSNSMVSDLFGKSRRTLAVCILGTGSSLNLLLLYPIAGWIGHHHGWRTAFLAAGLPGIALAILFFLTVKEPKRGAAEPSIPSLAPSALGDTVRFLFGARSYRYMLLGMTCMGAIVYSGSAWKSMFLVRVHGLNLSQIASTLGPIRGALTGVGILVGGLLADRFAHRGERWRLWVAAASCFLVAPSEALFLFADTKAGWLTGLAASSLILILHQGIAFSTCMNVARLRMRAVSISLAILFSGLFAQGIGPLLIGYLNDQLLARFGDAAIRYSMLNIVVCALVAGFAFLMAGRHVEADMRRANSTAAANAN